MDEPFAQLHAIGTLALAGLSQSMYKGLSKLFHKTLFTLKAARRAPDISQITMPRKEVFINAMHKDLFPWQSISTFSHYTRWLIGYHKRLTPRSNPIIAELRKIVAQQINDFLSPKWHITTPTGGALFPSAQMQSEWETPLCMPDEYVTEFLFFAATQSKENCKFPQIIEAYEKAAIEMCNAHKCLLDFTCSLQATQWTFQQKALAGRKEDLQKLLDDAKPMLTVNIPSSDSTTAEFLLINPAEHHHLSDVNTRALCCIWVPTQPHKKNFTPGPAHLERAHKWHASFLKLFIKAGGVPVDSATPDSPPPPLDMGFFSDCLVIEDIHDYVLVDEDSLQCTDGTSR